MNAIGLPTRTLVLIDRSRGIWIVQHRDPSGNMIAELTDFQASTILLSCATACSRTELVAECSRSSARELVCKTV